MSRTCHYEMLECPILDNPRRCHEDENFRASTESFDMRTVGECFLRDIDAGRVSQLVPRHIADALCRRSDGCCEGCAYQNEIEPHFIMNDERERKCRDCRAIIHDRNDERFAPEFD